MALAFLPEWEISIHYAELKQQKPSILPQLDSLLSYFENTWLDGGQFAVVQLDAGLQPPRRKRKYMAVDQRLKLLKEAYIGGEKSIDRYITGVAYNLSSFI